jgi:anaerobic selenocysteine-containing dehydrogenase
MFPIGGLYPPNILPDEINNENEDRIRAVWVDSANPVSTYADSNAYAQAFEKLELLVAVDVAMTETARMADYILPAASQFEKVEATAFNLEFPENFFHLRKPLFEPLAEALPEPEIYTRLLEKMNLIPTSFPILNNVVKVSKIGYLTALQILFKRKPASAKYASSIIYRTFGKTLPEKCESAAPLLGLTMAYTKKHSEEVKNAGFSGNLGFALFDKILHEKTGVIISKHKFSDVWKLIKNKDRKIYLEIPEMLEELRELKHENLSNDEFPFILMAGERRSYNANQIYRNPEWRKIDKNGTMRIHPEDAAEIGIANGTEVVCSSAIGSLNVFVEIDETVRRKVVTLPNGYGLKYKNGEPSGPQLNLITPGNHCDPLTKTPFHKYLPVKLKIKN